MFHLNPTHGKAMIFRLPRLPIWVYEYNLKTGGSGLLKDYNSNLSLDSFCRLNFSKSFTLGLSIINSVNYLRRADSDLSPCKAPKPEH